MASQLSGYGSSKLAITSEISGYGTVCVCVCLREREREVLPHPPYIGSGCCCCYYYY